MTPTVILPARLDLPASSDLLVSFIEARGEPLTVNGSEVVHLGTNCLQVLISAVKTWAQDGYDLSFAEPSDEFTTQLGYFGLSMDTLNSGVVPS